VRLRHKERLTLVLVRLCNQVTASQRYYGSTKLRLVKLCEDSTSFEMIFRDHIILTTWLILGSGE